MKQACWVYITTQNTDEASRVSAELINNRLVACTNIVPGMQSMYFWDGGVQKDSEAILIAKTREGLIDEVTEAVKRVHSYTVPCVIAMPIIGGNPDYLKWIFEETKDPG